MQLDSAVLTGKARRSSLVTFWTDLEGEASNPSRWVLAVRTDRECEHHVTQLNVTAV